MSEQEYLHASCVALNGKAAVILGASGSGKSTLALQMIGQGAKLVADDGVFLRCAGETLVAAAPEAQRGKIEVRGIGIVNVEFTERATVSLFVDLDTEESERLPPFRTIEYLGQKAPLYHRIKGDHLAIALTQILLNGRSD